MMMARMAARMARTMGIIRPMGQMVSEGSWQKVCWGDPKGFRNP